MTQLVTTYGAASADADYSLELVQEGLSASSSYADMADIVAMYRYAISGRSARTYQPTDCPVAIDGDLVTLSLGLYVFPTDLDLDYSLQVMPGLAGEGAAVTVAREFDLVIPMAARASIGFLSESFEIIEATHFYNESGAVIPTPSMEIVGTELLLDAVCFAVLRVRCIALGYLHTLEISVDKAAGYKIENFAATAQASWMSGGELQEDSIDLEIPACVESYLAYCEGDGDLIASLGKAGGGDDPIPIVQYNQCIGKVLGVRYE